MRSILKNLFYHTKILGFLENKLYEGLLVSLGYFNENIWLISSQNSMKFSLSIKSKITNIFTANNKKQNILTVYRLYVS